MWFSRRVPPERAADVTKNHILQVLGCVLFNWCLRNRAIEKSWGIITKKMDPDRAILIGASIVTTSKQTTV
jgi:hypothetical protein